jgi:hypothetical protein
MPQAEKTFSQNGFSCFTDDELEYLTEFFYGFVAGTFLTNQQQRPEMAPRIAAIKILLQQCFGEWRKRISENQLNDYKTSMQVQVNEIFPRIEKYEQEFMDVINKIMEG